METPEEKSRREALEAALLKAEEAGIAISAITVMAEAYRGEERTRAAARQAQREQLRVALNRGRARITLLDTDRVPQGTISALRDRLSRIRRQVFQEPQRDREPQRGRELQRGREPQRGRGGRRY